MNVTESRDTFTNVTESENRGKLGKGTGKCRFRRTCLKDRTEEGENQDQRDETNVAGSIPAAWHDSKSSADHHEGKSSVA
jgi:hypothetical protein